MTPQHTGATADDPRTWGAADMETSQNLAAIGSPAARPIDPPPPTCSDDAHQLAA